MTEVHDVDGMPGGLTHRVWVAASGEAVICVNNRLDRRDRREALRLAREAARELERQARSGWGYLVPLPPPPPGVLAAWGLR